jgi:hypothetical protein
MLYTTKLFATIALEQVCYRDSTGASATCRGPLLMRIIRATHLGMCFGVRDAIGLALASSEAGPLTILGDLVHNPTVLGALAARGIAVADDAAQARHWSARAITW